MTKSLSEKLRVISSDDMRHVSALALRDNYHEGGEYDLLKSTKPYMSGEQRVTTGIF